MPTSGWRSCVPPNHAATKPVLVSAMVEAWHCGNGADSKMNSDLSKAGELDAAKDVIADIARAKVKQKMDVAAGVRKPQRRNERHEPDERTAAVLSRSTPER